METTKQLEISSLVWVYGVLVLGAMIWDSLAYGNPFYAWRHFQRPEATTITAALVFVGVIAAISIILPRIFDWAHNIENDLRVLLTPISYLQVIILGLLSGVCEEWFFRGILQERLGLMTASLVFGLSHFLPHPRLWMYFVWATVIGFSLGILYEASGSLWLVTLTHAAINSCVLLFLNLGKYQNPELG